MSPTKSPRPRLHETRRSIERFLRRWSPTAVVFMPVAGMTWEEREAWVGERFSARVRHLGGLIVEVMP